MGPEISLAMTCIFAASKVIAKLKELHAAKRHNTLITREIDLFISSLNENIELLREQLPNKRGSWAIESLTADLNKAADFLEEGQKNGNLQKFWNAKEVKDELTRLRQDIINNFQVKLFVTTLEVVIDGNEKMENFEGKMLELSSLWAAKSHSAVAQIRQLLQPLVVGLRRQDQTLQSFISTVRGNENKVETSTETQKFLEDVLANLEDLTDEGSSSIRTAPEDDRDEYLDPFTKELMSDPVKCTDGHTYDRFSVIQYNLSQRTPLVIACDDLNVRRILFQRFANEDVESKFRSSRQAYRDQAFEVANKGHSAEAVNMLEGVLQWAPNDVECLKKTKELKDEIVAEQRRRAERLSAPPPVIMVPPQQATIPPKAPTHQDHPWPNSYQAYGNTAYFPHQQNPSKQQNLENLAVGIIILVLCFPCSICCIPCLFPNLCGD